MVRFAQIFALLQLALLCAFAQPEQPEQPDRSEPASPDWVEPNVDRSEPRNRGWDRHSMDRHAVGEDIIIGPNEVAGNLVLFGGSLDVRGTVDGDIVMIGGPVNVTGEVTGGLVLIGGGLEISGTVERDVVVVMGGATLKNKALLESSGVFIGGPFMFDSGAELLGEKVTIPLGDVLQKVQWFKAWLVQGLLLGRLLPFGVTWPWYVATFALVFYLLLLVIFPGSIKNTYSALETRPIASLIAGLLAMILAAPLAVILAMTVVGLPAIPFVNIAMFLAAVVGKTAVICFLGRSLGRTIGGTALQAPFTAFVVGAILLTLVYTVPVLGILAWGLGTIFGLGAAFVALGNSWSREEKLTAPVSVPIQTLRPSMTGAAASGAAPSAEALALPLQPPIAQSLSAADTLLLPRAGFWARSFASLLDLILLALLVPVVGPFSIPIAIIYFVAMWTWKGTTIGSIVLGLKVIRTDGRPVNFAVALVRSLASLFSGFVLFLGFLWAAWDRDKQSWHDKIAGTVVVKMPKDLALI